MSLWDQKIKPMLAHSSEPFDSDEWIFEIKFDGTRAIAYVDAEEKTVRLLNRRMLWFENRYPELKNLWQNISASKAILDGEIVVFHEGKPDFYKLAEREHVDSSLRAELLAKEMPATYIVFDILHLDGKDLVDLPLMERKQILASVLKESSNVAICQWIEGKGKELFEAAVSKGLEGIMAKKKDSLYELGKRSKKWLKIKATKTLDAVIVGYTTGTGEREEFGSLIVAAYYKGKLKYIGKVGTGFSSQDIAYLKQELDKIKTTKCPFEQQPELDLPEGRQPIWVEPKLVCEVKFLELTKDLQMRAPVFLRLRQDKSAEECTIE